MEVLMIDKGSPGGALHLGKFIQNHESCILLHHTYYERSHVSPFNDIFGILIGRKL